MIASIRPEKLTQLIGYIVSGEPFDVDGEGVTIMVVILSDDRGTCVSVIALRALVSVPQFLICFSAPTDRARFLKSKIELRRLLFPVCCQLHARG
jgi:hypothetical protein